jgi:prepilin-type N-terminal cleavage/methylation domain-containing protein
MNRYKKQNGFTLVELVVAVGVLAVVLAFSGVIFELTADTRQISSANSQIMDKFRTITRQLDADFSGLRKNAPVFIWFDNTNDPNRFDEIMFFANGDFQSIQTYYNGQPDPDKGSPIHSNIARIWYGHAIRNGIAPWSDDEIKRILSRRQHLLSADTGLNNYDITNVDEDFSIDGKNYPKEDIFEHDNADCNSLSKWQAVLNDETNSKELVEACMATNANPENGRAEIDIADANTYHLMFSESLSSFAIQWGYFADSGNGKQLYWYPNSKDFGTPDDSDNDFYDIGKDIFGVYFNSAEPVGTTGDWYKKSVLEYEEDETGNNENFNSEFPQALKFTFTIYDEKGVIKDGRKFSYIVYLE